MLFQMRTKEPTLRITKWLRIVDRAGAEYHLRQSVQPAQMYDSRCRSVCDITSPSPSMNQTENTSCNPYKEHLKDISKRSPTGVLLTTPRGDSGLRHKSGVYGLNGHRAIFVIDLSVATCEHTL